MITYMTLPGDTLEKIASDLKVENPKYIRDFHNAYCALHDRLVDPILLKTGTLLHIPFGDEIKKLNKKINENGESLYYHPPHGKIPFKIPLLEGRYTARHHKYQDNTLLTNYRYQVELKYLKHEKGQHLFSVQQSGSLKDGHESDSKISSLAKACAAIIFPLEIRINETGKLTDAAFHHPETIVKEELEALKKYFTDEWSASYINQLKKKAEDKKQILADIRNTLPIQFLSGSFYNAQYESWTDSGIYHEFLPWLTNASPIRFELYNRILPKEPDATDNNRLKVVQKGTSVDYRNLNQLYDSKHKYDESSSFNADSVICHHEAEYCMSRNDLEVQKITGHFEIQIGNVTEKEVFTLEKQLK
ncbi:hypothetical protein [Chryseobacterium indologenes]|uniref:LysM domain-containing protein n=1 Tax=Chryseobacterium indologenes TaxID=253 RepID=A0A0N0IUM3_CHRID|nr:hypothetical protein [Chryseobacterium indologenes]KPE49722.1 hypothetical protein AOB46_18500 [Chryseobacterium indologenes]